MFSALLGQAAPKPAASSRDSLRRSSSTGDLKKTGTLVVQIVEATGTTAVPKGGTTSLVWIVFSIKLIIPYY